MLQIKEKAAGAGLILHAQTIIGLQLIFHKRIY